MAPSLLASAVLLAASYLLGEGWPDHWAEMTDYCPSQLLASRSMSAAEPPSPPSLPM